MSHELTQRVDGRFEFAFNQDHGQAWHGLGTPITAEHIHDIPHWAQASGMDWKVQRSLVRYAPERGTPDADLITIPDRVVLFRSDTKAHLGIASTGYKPVHPGDVLGVFHDAFAKYGLVMSAAGTLQGGRKFWATARIDSAAPVSPRDTIRSHLLVSTSADGTAATEARLTATRTVCANTLAIAQSEKGHAVRVSHKTAFDANSIVINLEAASKDWSAHCEALRELSARRVRQTEAQLIIARILAKSATPTPEAIKTAEDSAGYKRIMGLFTTDQRGIDLPGVRGTAYGLLQAVTEYADHHVRAATEQNRLISAQWGPGAALKDNTFAALLNMARDPAPAPADDFAMLLAK